MSNNENETQVKGDPPPYYTHDAAIPAHLVASVSALGAAVAAGGLGALPQRKSSPEELARLVDRLQETFGAGNGGGSGKGGGGVTPPPPSPFTAGCVCGAAPAPAPAVAVAGEAGEKQLKGEQAEMEIEMARKRARYRVQVEEAEDEHWAAKK